MQRHANGRSVVEKASEFLANTRGVAKERVAKAQGFVKHRPMLSLLMGMGAGLMVGLFFARRSPKVELVLRSKGKSE